MRTDTPHGDAYAAVRMIYDKSPGHSWRRLNGALQSTLSGAIEAHLSFLPGDFTAICNDMNGGYWMGNSRGSTCGERYYSLAVKAGHTPACISFEHYAGRPAALWAESVKTPERLCIGSDLTWAGLRVTVTNMRPNHLIACTYGAREAGHEGMEVGDVGYLDGGYRPVEHFKRLDDGALIVRMGAAQKSRDSETRKPERVIRIPYDALAATRKAADATRRQALKDISLAETPKSLHEVAERLQAADRNAYRHFDIEDFRKAIQFKQAAFQESARREEALTEANSRLAQWCAGGDLNTYYAGFRDLPVCLRVRGRYVETSTGHSVSLESVRKVLPVVMKHRHGAVDRSFVGLEVDIHPVKRISGDGVLIGCTLIPWPEVDRLQTLLTPDKISGPREALA